MSPTPLRGADEPEASVVIATYNRRARLLVCLEHLARQGLGSHRFEVIVVSDGSSDGTVAAAGAAGTRLGLDLRAIDIGHGGPGHARNAGAAAARAKVLAFVDDDVEVEPAWLQAALPHFASPVVGGVEGRTEPALGAESLYRGNVVNLVGGLYPTCNIFYRRETFLALGGFDERLRRSREDSDLAWRVLDSGREIRFEPRAAAVHRSHQASLLRPLAMAATLPDNVYLWRKHPGRDRVRPAVYGSDLAKAALTIAGLAAAAAGSAALATLLALSFTALVARTMARELVPARVRRPDRLLLAFLVYSLLPFANLYFLARGVLAPGPGR